jgi:mRNA interferase MazF
MIINRWEVYRASLDPVVGSEQGKSRPVLVVSENEVNIALSTVTVVPLTGHVSGSIIYPNEVLIPEGACGLPKASVALCHQIRTVDKRRLSLLYGALNRPRLRRDVCEAMAYHLGID